MNIQVTLDGRPVDAVLNDNPAARDFAALLPLTLDLKDFHGTERVADLPRELDTTGAPEPVAATVGDIAYYAPWGNLALFYQDGPAPSRICSSSATSTSAPTSSAERPASPSRPRLTRPASSPAHRCPC
jgi:hypothetical protein